MQTPIRLSIRGRAPLSLKSLWYSELLKKPQRVSVGRFRELTAKNLANLRGGNHRCCAVCVQNRWKLPVCTQFQSANFLADGPAFDRTLALNASLCRGAAAGGRRLPRDANI